MDNDLTRNDAPRLVDIGPSLGAPGICLVWDLPSPMRGVSSSIVGGGIGPVSWALNMTVDDDYGRFDPDQHLLDVAHRLDLEQRGIAMMTAVAVSAHQTAESNGAEACATVGVSRPVWAADLAGRIRPEAGPQPEPDTTPGTINLIVTVPVQLTDAALVNAISTVTEAKVQALLDAGVDGTGTASDAIAVLCATGGPAEQFGGPRSTWGARIALAAYDAVTSGVTAQRA